MVDIFLQSWTSFQQLWASYHYPGYLTTVVDILPQCWTSYHSGEHLTTVLDILPQWWTSYYNVGHLTTMVGILPQSWTSYHSPGNLTCGGHLTTVVDILPHGHPVGLPKRPDSLGDMRIASNPNKKDFLDGQKRFKYVRPCWLPTHKNTMPVYSSSSSAFPRYISGFTIFCVIFAYVTNACI